MNSKRFNIKQNEVMGQLFRLSIEPCELIVTDVIQSVAVYLISLLIDRHKTL